MKHSLGRPKNEHVKVRSSLAIVEIDYNIKTKVLTCHMTDGSSLDYGNVPRDVFEAFQQAESKGKFFNAHIRNTFKFLS